MSYFKAKSATFTNCFITYENCAMCGMQLLVKDRLPLVRQCDGQSADSMSCGLSKC